MFSRHRRALGTVTAVALLLATTACTSNTGSGTAMAAPDGEPAPVRTATTPNIVYVLVDDLSKNLVQHMPNVVALQKEGTTFSNYAVTDSLCCPSRASILTGQFPHNTGIFKNHGSDGGFKLFHSKGKEKSTFATDLQAAGYRTAFLGKYLNEYQPRNPLGTGPYTPPGWDYWVAGGNAYDNFDYSLNENGTVTKYGTAPGDYLTDVLSAKASAFITSTAATGKPFMMEVATYAPHSPYTPAPRDAASFPGLKAPRTAAYDKLPSPAPQWLANHTPLTKKEKAATDADFRKRVQSVQSIDRMIGSLRATLTTAGVAGDTIVVFNSDNGYHLGEYRMASGKQTAYDTDVNVPLVVAGPGVQAGKTVDALVENIDLRATFADLAGSSAPADADGRSIKPLLAGEVPDQWRTVQLIEHRDPAADPLDPDYQVDKRNIPPAYDAIRTATFTYVEYVDGTREYYDRTTDPDQLRNLGPTLKPERIAELHAALRGLATCVGAAACATAGRAIS
ncbi:sulfatase [Actinoplanes sp. NBRC 101535]|uniref:sulfatase family protein n=1 Tax=Actinoplanes sp. NBRC 101535 TaxID=3032196 RepID=UPI002556B1DF|nr:sulfatase [Actinoplanes sp. NBRC 101535]